MSMTAETLGYTIMIVCLGLLLGLTTGCIGPDPENRSARPWNTPQPWEHGVPGAISERR
ncbi:MAG: hypothetical protein VX413_07160 [Verrucomicrobiota bacterium]|nr:hypothetical protein [Verrucomicrobiota bacterium]